MNPSLRRLWRSSRADDVKGTGVTRAKSLGDRLCGSAVEDYSSWGGQLEGRWVLVVRFFWTFLVSFFLLLRSLALSSFLSLALGFGCGCGWLVVCHCHTLVCFAGAPAHNPLSLSLCISLSLLRKLVEERALACVCVPHKTWTRFLIIMHCTRCLHHSHPVLDLSPHVTPPTKTPP